MFVRFMYGFCNFNSIDSTIGFSCDGLRRYRFNSAGAAEKRKVGLQHRTVIRILWTETIHHWRWKKHCEPGGRKNKRICTERKEIQVPTPNFWLGKVMFGLLKDALRRCRFTIGHQVKEAQWGKIFFRCGTIDQLY